MNERRVAVAMSGGVDSTVAAALLKEEGWGVEGIHLTLWGDPNTALPEDACRRLDIPLHILDLKSEFKELVVEPFLSQYARGLTPNPCVTCNQHIKFGQLLDTALKMGFKHMATGHYARIESAPHSHRLLRGSDTSKDQSYFLYTLTQPRLKHIMFPVGGLTKAEVKKLAAMRGLLPKDGRESTDICFIPSGGISSFMTRHLPQPPGDIVDTKGRVLGKHQGLAHYTIGQRQGLGIASTKRLYVLQLDAARNEVMVGGEEGLLKTRLIADSINWVGGRPPHNTDGITAKIRYQATPAQAALKLKGERAEVSFATPQRAIAPGQAVVFYHGDQLLGGGTIQDVG